MGSTPQKQQFKLNKDLRELSFEIGQKEGTIKALKQEVEELRGLEAKFRSALGILKKEVEGVGDHIEGIHEAAEVLRQANKPLATAAQKIMESKREGNVIALNLRETV